MKLVQPSEIIGELNAPSSKSHSQRLLLISLFTNDMITISSLSRCDDTQVILKFLKDAGKEIEFIEDEIRISGDFRTPVNEIELGESGFAARVLPIIMLAYDEVALFNGSPQLFRRPLDYLTIIAYKLGGKIEINRTTCQIIKTGFAKHFPLEFDDSISSQYLSAVLYLFALQRNYEPISIKSLKSSGYVDLTFNVLADYGIQYLSNNNRISLNKFKQKENYLKVEGDWSAAAFFLVLGSLKGELVITNLNIDSKQPDRKIYYLLEEIGADIICCNGDVKIRKSDLKPFTIDTSETPDLVPALIPLAAMISGKSTIRGVKRLIYKETNRLEILITEYKKLGVELCLDDDAIIIRGNKIIGGRVDSYGDHRLAMSFAIAGVLSEKGIYVNWLESVNKSYPDFIADLEKLGAKIK